jgi:hypothetical protein
MIATICQRQLNFERFRQLRIDPLDIDHDQCIRARTRGQLVEPETHGTDPA